MPITGYWQGFIYLGNRTRLEWRHFEMIRLRLAWGLTRRRRLSRKARFKAQRRVKKVSFNFFRRKFRRPRIGRIFWYGGFPHTVTTGKKRGMRMGKGKGDPRGWHYVGYEGSIILRVAGVTPVRLYYLLRHIAQRLPGKAYAVCLSDKGGGGLTRVGDWCGGGL